MRTQKSVVIKKLFHRDNHCLGIYFDKDFEIITEVKKIPGVKYSNTNKCWYIPDQKQALSKIIELLKGKVWVDDSSLKSNEVVISAPPLKIEPIELLTQDQLQALRMIEQKLKLRGYSENTQRTYTSLFKNFLLFFKDTHPVDLTETEIHNYLLYLVEQRKLSKSAQNQNINAIKFFYEKVLMQERKVYYLERPMKEKTIARSFKSGRGDEYF
ncbi:MAG: site-specific integrase [Cytophagales bacterium]|nr:site-specific integrase [Cytophagales bacterium]